MTGSLPAPTQGDTMDTLFRHNLWANTCLFQVCSEVDEERLSTAMVGGYGSIRETLEHIANSEYSYWHRITTGKPYRRPEGLPSRTVAELLQSIRVSGEGLVETAPKVQAGDQVEVDWDGTPRPVPSAILLVQAINHATEHWAQIMAMSW